ncbi:reverse transcriptase domain-containing protein [Tanacetum coccineum]
MLNKLPSKEKDPRSFTIPCDIGNLHINNALADLGASISLMPYTMYEKLGLGEPKPTRMSLELADRSIEYLRGIAENVLIKIDKFILPINFVILDMREDSKIPINLGRLFLATTRAMINVFNKKITLRVGNEEVIFDVDQSIKRPPAEDGECYGIDYLDTTIHSKTQELLEDDQLDSFLVNNLEKSIDQSDLESCGMADDGSESKIPIRRIEQVNTLYSESQETKGPDKTQYDHLYSASANEINEKKTRTKRPSFPLRIRVLEKCKGEIACKMSYIKEISLSFYTQKILMEESFKPVIQPQRRLNPKVQDVVKNEIVRLLDSGLIYPISDSQWVSPIHVVQKKGGMTVVLNDKNELIPSRTVTGWRVCIDYRFFQIPKEQEKTTFTCPYGTFAYRRMPFGLCKEDFMEVFMDDFSGVRSFLGHAGFYRRFIKDFSMISKTMTQLLMKDVKFDFSEDFYTDHSALKYLFNKKDAKPSLIRWVLLLQGFIIKIKDKKGAENLAADHLSRLENPNIGELAKDEIPDKFPDEHLMILKAKLNDKEPWYADYVNYIVGKVVPPKWTPKRRKRDKILEILAHCHSGLTRGHHSALVTVRKVYEAGFYWPSIFKDAKDYVCKVFDVWGLDFMGPFPDSRGNKYILVAVDYMSKWVEAQALPTNDAHVMVKFLKGLFTRFRVPKALISDRGTHFCNSELEKALQKYGVTHKISTAYHPQTNGQTEVTNRAIKSILERSVGYNPKD